MRLPFASLPAPPTVSPVSSLMRCEERISSPPRIGSRGGPPRGKAKTKPSAKESEAATRTFQSQCDSADFLANLLVRKIALFQRQLPTHLQHLDLAGDGVEFHQADRTLVGFDLFEHGGVRIGGDNGLFVLLDECAPLRGGHFGQPFPGNRFPARALKH